jgi:hypothetical protein
MKKRRFAEGGGTSVAGDDVEMGPNPNIDDDTRERARKFVADNATPAKPKVVTKEELAKSGLSLRDYMNKQQGLTRRADPRDREAGTQAAPMSREDLISQIPTGGDRAAPTASAGNSASGSELGRNVSNTLNALAVSKGVPMAQIAAEAAMGTRAGKALSGLMSGKQAAEVRKIEPTMSTVSAAKKAELAGELRRGATPTKFTSPSKPTAAKKTRKFNEDEAGTEFRKGGPIKKYAAGGSVSSRADGIAQRGKTRGRMC